MLVYLKVDRRLVAKLARDAASDHKDLKADKWTKTRTVQKWSRSAR